MLERGDLIGVHEPFCNLEDHGTTDVFGRTVRSVNAVKDALCELAESNDVFIKEVTDRSHCAILNDHEFLARLTHSFLVRRPDEIAASFYAVKPDMECAEVGVENLWRAYSRISGLSPSPPPIVDSDALVTDPEKTMSLYCRALGIPFKRESLNWKAGHRAEWHLTDRWHESVAHSSHFTSDTTDYEATVANTPHLAQFSSHHWRFYERLRARAINSREPGPPHSDDHSR
jgi:hypothetical protein